MYKFSTVTGTNMCVVYVYAEIIIGNYTRYRVKFTIFVCNYFTQSFFVGIEQVSFVFSFSLPPQVQNVHPLGIIQATTKRNIKRLSIRRKILQNKCDSYAQEKFHKRYVRACVKRSQQKLTFLRIYTIYHPCVRSKSWRTISRQYHY